MSCFSWLSANAGLRYTYNETGGLLTTRSSNANGVSVDYGYDAVNRLSSAKANNLVTLNGGVTNYTYEIYEMVGSLQSYQYPNASLRAMPRTHSIV